MVEPLLIQDCEAVKVVAVLPPVEPEPCPYHFLVMAYWPRGAWWSDKARLCQGRLEAENLALEMEANGWIGITIMALPALPVRSQP